MSTAKFITIEGIEGTGKSTCVKWITQWLQNQGMHLTVTREPGGTEVAEKIREVILSHYQETMINETELLLFFAARAQHIHHFIKPALANNTWVICDRFTDASYAYQCGGRGIAQQKIQALEQWVHPDLQPDLTLLLHAPVEVALQRLQSRNEDLDRIENQQQLFFQRVQDFYFQLAEQYPHRFRLIDASQPLDKVEQQLEQVLVDIIHE